MNTTQQLALKKDLNGKTLIGEYVGAKDLQHVIAYKEETLIFYSIVENDSHKICFLPEDSTSFFKKYNLKQTVVESWGVFWTFTDLKDGLNDLIFEVGNAPISR